LTPVSHKPCGVVGRGRMYLRMVINDQMEQVLFALLGYDAPGTMWLFGMAPGGFHIGERQTDVIIHSSTTYSDVYDSTDTLNNWFCITYIDFTYTCSAILSFVYTPQSWNTTKVSMRIRIK
jgi:hypothetical protein